MNNGALGEMKVIEVCQVMAGPFCGCLLADMGADVIKVENPEGGDTARDMGRYFDGGEGHGFMNLNRNKRSIVVNLKEESGIKLLKELIKKSDIFIENLRPGTIDKMGLGYNDLKKINDSIIYASISGYGKTGPFSGKGGFDLVSQGLSSLMSFTGEQGGTPSKIPVPICDLNAGIYTAFSILSAYIYKQKTGMGQFIDTSLTDSGLGYTFWASSQFFPSGEIPIPRGSAHEMTAPYQAIKCKDGYLVLGAANQKSWERLCEAIGKEEYLTHPDYAENASRTEKYKQLAKDLELEFIKKNRDEWIKILDEAKVPCGPILNMQETFSHPQIKARDMCVEIEHPKAGPIKVLGFPPKLSLTPGVIRKPSPVLGEHTNEILIEFGISKENILELQKGKIIN